MLGLGGIAAGQNAERPPIEELAHRLQRRYDAIHDFSAVFVHVYEGGLLRKQVTERGTVLIKKPGRMRWTYLQPERKEFVSDGVRLYAYVPADRQVMVSPVPTSDQATSAVLFLAGQGNLVRDFTIEYATSPSPDTYTVRLTPKQPQPEFEWLMLGVDRATLALRSLTTVDVQGGRSTFSFSEFKENLGLPDSRFVFTIPRGVEVVTDAPPKR